MFIITFYLYINFCVENTFNSLKGEEEGFQDRKPESAEVCSDRPEKTDQRWERHIKEED